MNLPESLSELLSDFESITNPRDKADMIRFYSDSFKPVSSEIATRPYLDANLVTSCVSKVYVWANQLENNTLSYHFAVENPQGVSAQALCAILDETLSGVSLDLVLQVPSDIVHIIFGKELSMGKLAGLTGIISSVKNYANQYVNN